jgi:hypothetical protein
MLPRYDWVTDLIVPYRDTQVHAITFHEDTQINAQVFGHSVTVLPSAVPVVYPEYGVKVHHCTCNLQ